MTILEIVNKVSALVNNPSFTEDDYLAFVNQGLLEVASIVDLTALEASATVTTSTSASKVALPVDYLRDVYAVIDEARRDYEIGMVASIEELEKRYGELGYRTGEIEFACDGGGYLYYAPLPTVQRTLTIRYFKRPTAASLADATSRATEPTCIPAPFHWPVLVNYAAMMAYSQILDGVGGEGGQQDKYMNLYMAALSQLSNNQRNVSRRRNTYRRPVVWF